jgi:hypothetical protein
MLGDQKIQVSSEYFGTRPDYEGITAWGADRLKVNEDCSSKFNRLEIHANLSSGQPSEPFGQRPFDVVITYTPNKENHAITDRAESISKNADYKLIHGNSDQNVYETAKNEIGHLSRKTIYLNAGQVTKILECEVKQSGRTKYCNLAYHFGGFDVDIAADYDSLINFNKIEYLASSFISNVNIKGTENE